MSKSKIQWTEYSWNPVCGCTKVSAGCQNCYAEKMAMRLAAMGMATPSKNPEYMGFEEGWDGHIELCEHRLDQPLHWKKPRRIFVCSMSDLFHEKVPFEFIDRVFDVIINKAPQHIYQILTKRPQRMKEYLDRWIEAYNTFYLGLQEFTQFHNHLWLGVSVENQKAADERIPILLRIPAAKRFVSCEPALEGIDFNNVSLGGFYCPQCREFYNAPKALLSDCCGATIIEVKNTQSEKCSECGEMVEADRIIPQCPFCDNHGGGRYIQPDFADCFSGDKEGAVLEKIDWLIVGCESGSSCRPCKLEWVRSIVAQRKAAGMPVFVKQIPMWSINRKSRMYETIQEAKLHFGEQKVREFVVHDIKKFPKDLQVQEYPE